MDRSKWEYKKLGEVCAPKTDILRANKLFGKDDVIEYIDISSIDNSAHYITQPTSYLFHEAPSRAQQKVEQGDILYSLVRPNLKNIAVVTSSNTEKYVASSGFCVLRSKDIDNRYLYHLVLRPLRLSSLPSRRSLRRSICNFERTACTIEIEQ